MLGALLNFKEPKFLASNVVAADKEFREAIRPTRFVELGGLKIGITAVLDPATYQTLQDANAAMLAVKPPDEVLTSVLADIRNKAKVAVLMVQGPYAEAKRLAEKFPGFDVVIGTSETSDPDEHPEIVNGKTLLIPEPRQEREARRPRRLLPRLRNYGWPTAGSPSTASSNRPSRCES